jgi:polyphosphate kinase 2 (PPK2 family)
MLERTSHAAAPWRVVHSDTKKIARLELLRDLLGSFHYPGKTKKLTRTDSDVVFFWNPEAAREGKIAK